MSHPYRSLPRRAFWSRAVGPASTAGTAGTGGPPSGAGGQAGVATMDLDPPRLRITGQTRIATAGSCFAQHIGRALRGAGLQVLDAEPLPPQIPQAIAARYGYGLYSARHGNIYTARQMAELLAEAEAGAPAPLIWENAGRYRDALRPALDPGGMDSAADVALHRALHLERYARMLAGTDLFIFTLGLTEAWQDLPSGRTLPLCPGVAGGTFDPSRHRLKQFRHAEICADLDEILARLRRFNPAMRLLVTVSPVGLGATATGAHVAMANSAAKATLRAAAAEFVADRPAADYFPAYEIVTQPAFGGPWFDAGLREVAPEGVSAVMARFFALHGLADAQTPAPPHPGADDIDPACDEALLAAFAR